MYTHSDALTTLFDLLNSLNALISQLTTQQQAAKKRGLELYQLGEFEECETHLTISALAGDAPSQYALGEAIRRRVGSVSPEAQACYRLAADQDHVYALMRLGGETNLAKAKTLAQSRADAGDGEAMLQLYELTQDRSWLVKAGDAGCAEAYYIAALLFDKNQASDNRDSMLRYAAFKDFPPAMTWLGNMQTYYRNLSYQRIHLEKRLALNELDGVMTYAAALAGINVEETSRYYYPINLTHAYGLYWLVMDSTRQNARHREAATCLQQLGTELSAEQIETAKAYGRQWKADHPALSEFRLTYSDMK
ncbi:sel1 repeat family protein [Pseudomonas sp. SED1]|uniref:sel1 repeat family protein n=1 Tax=Pseudomonas sp. SED1 TaxID=3056845 RepID=UPI00296F04C8|nr:sel1 repeat family protein [Pseudomonas sp. SED1]MDY0834556.1 sel1 repeat family protein [Pseudomonas sp. SED1]